MKHVHDKATVRTTRDVRLEFTHAEIARILLNHWHTVSKTTPLDMSVVAERFHTEQDEGGEYLFLDVTFSKETDQNDRPLPTPLVWWLLTMTDAAGAVFFQWHQSPSADEAMRQAGRQAPKASVSSGNRVPVKEPPSDGWPAYNADGSPYLRGAP